MTIYNNSATISVTTNKGDELGLFFHKSDGISVSVNGVSAYTYQVIGNIDYLGVNDGIGKMRVKRQDGKMFYFDAEAHS